MPNLTEVPTRYGFVPLPAGPHTHAGYWEVDQVRHYLEPISEALATASVAIGEGNQGTATALIDLASRLIEDLLA